MGLATNEIFEEMSNRIFNIETYRYHSGIINFAGTLRNEKKFELFQNVFIKYGDKMCQCKIVGVVLPPHDNPDYIYTVEIPEEFVEDNDARLLYKCDKIFSSIEEAKASAMRENDIRYKLNKEVIERFFDRYE